MTRTPIPDDVAAWVVSTLRSVVDLEAVLLLRADPGRRWTAADVSERLYVGLPEAAEVLDYLTARGLASVDGEARRYDPGVPADGMVGRVATLYSTHLIAVTRLIHERPSSRVQQFADAFRLRKESE
ncbi:MAG TPA: hypothetical protein VEA81_14920 [Burkholderiaceae bacterium]|nr:hypothetical protein [Burkholderiaceae bacterium]